MKIVHEFYVYNENMKVQLFIKNNSTFNFHVINEGEKVANRCEFFEIMENPCTFNDKYYFESYVRMTNKNLSTAL
jgi:hypothetical protein